MMMMLCNLLTYLCACYWLWGVCCSQGLHVNAWTIAASATWRASSAASPALHKKSTHSSATSTNRLYAEASSGQNHAHGDGQENNKNKNQESSSSSAAKSNENWLEDWAQEGAPKIAQLDIHQRTQRTRLAEMAEDKIYELHMALQKLVDEDTGEITDWVQAKDIALQTKSLQEQYRALVTGGPSTVLQAMASLEENNRGGGGGKDEENAK
ncbi:hypothetical protein ACA910_012115 [Epithemia clementina (nom. ined.)]